MKHANKSGKAPAALSQPQSRAISDHDIEVETFVGNLQNARSVYRGCPELVTAKRFPEQWRQAFRQFYKEVPSDHETQKPPSLKILTEELTPATNLVDENGAIQDPPT